MAEITKTLLKPLPTNELSITEWEKEKLGCHQRCNANNFHNYPSICLLLDLYVLSQSNPEKKALLLPF